MNRDDPDSASSIMSSHLLTHLDAQGRAHMVDVGAKPGTVSVTTTARVHARTGVEMEAMVGCAAGALCVYDMVKGMERGVVLERIELLEKRGGRTGSWRRYEQD